MASACVSSKSQKERGDTRAFTSWALGGGALPSSSIVFSQSSVSRDKGVENTVYGVATPQRPGSKRSRVPSFFLKLFGSLFFFCQRESRGQTTSTYR